MNASASDFNRFFNKNIDKYHQLNDYTAEGFATIYSKKFHNKITASGMKFSNFAHTAASLKLPLMSVLKVTNKRNGKSIYVLINDRGPYNTNAIIDISPATAQILHYLHSDKIQIEFDIKKTLEIFKDRKLISNFGISI